MGTVATTTTQIPLDYPSHATIARVPGTTAGSMYLFGRTDGTSGYRVWRSTDGGSSWATYASFTRSNLIEWSSLVVDKNGYAHLAYRVSESSLDKVYYRRLNLTSAAWSSELQCSLDDANGGVAGAIWQGVDLAVVRHSNGAYAIAVCGAYTIPSTAHGVCVMGVSINTSGTIYKNNGIIQGDRFFLTYTTPPGRSTPVCELQHNGDGFTSTTPHLWVAWGRTKLFMTKLAWMGTAHGWQGASSHQTIDSSIPSVDYVAGRWDGSRWMMSVIDTDDPSIVDIYERNAANSQTTVRQTPQHPNGTVRTLGLSYDSSSKNLRVYAVGTTNATLYSVDFVRQSSTWGSWVQVSADAIAASPPDEFTLRRGGTSGNARYDIGYTTGTVSPFTIKSLHQTVGYAPSTPTWETSAQPYSNGGAADVAASLTLDWTFSDLDPSDTQAAYALRKQIGAGSFTYYNAGAGTWGGSEVFNSSATSSVTLASAWAASTDAEHSFAVKVRDTGALDSQYSAALKVTPSAKVNPAITSPTAAQVLTTNRVTVTWTAAEQKSYRVVLLTNPGALQVHDSGFRAGTDLSYSPPVDLADGTGWTVQLTTTNLEGLASTTQTRNFTIDYVEPPIPTLVATPVTASGWISVAITNPAPSGGQPALSRVDLYRRIGATGDATRIASGLGSGATYLDWQAAARTAYQYQAITYGVNGTQAASAWTS